MERNLTFDRVFGHYGLCPHLVRLPVNFTKYRAVSRQIMDILHSYSPCVEPLSLDEGFLDLTG
ncbi:MAG: hypothetical protein KJ927_08995, partial [Candidatus Eisenbacteria bacterium]|nr:hypothetical protein [Candidatus Eisenbacteria bacterium]